MKSNRFHFILFYYVIINILLIILPTLCWTKEIVIGKPFKKIQNYRKYDFPYEHWINDFHQIYWKKYFDNFVLSNGGIVDPWDFYVPSNLEKIENIQPIFKKKYTPMKDIYFETLEQSKNFDKRQKPFSVIMKHHYFGFEKNGFEKNQRAPKKLRYSKSEGRPVGCIDHMGFHFEGETWFSRGCRRHKCLHFRGKYFVETDSCDTEIFNTTYKCIIEADLNANYPNCCPRYNCNPDNLGNRVNVNTGDTLL